MRVALRGFVHFVVRQNFSLFELQQHHQQRRPCREEEGDFHDLGKYCGPTDAHTESANLFGHRQSRLENLNA